MKKKTYVYCVQEQSRDAFGPIKIGIAVNIETRLINLQVGNPMPLAVYGLIGPMPAQSARRLEENLHCSMSAHRIRGEWFSGRALPLFEKAQALHSSDGVYRSDAAFTAQSFGNRQHRLALAAQSGDSEPSRLNGTNDQSST